MSRENADKKAAQKERDYIESEYIHQIRSIRDRIDMEQKELLSMKMCEPAWVAEVLGTQSELA